MRMSVGAKLFLAFGTIIAFVLVLALFEARESDKVHAEVTRLHDRGLQLTERLSSAAATLQAIRSRNFEHMARTDPSAQRELEGAVSALEAKLYAALEAYRTAFGTDEQQGAQAVKLREAYDRYAALRNAQVYEPSRRGDSQAAIAAATGEVGEAFEAVVGELDALLDQHLARNTARYGEVEAAIARAERISELGTVAATLVAALLAFWLSRSISRRLVHLSGVARALGEGALERRAHLSNDDEITDVGRALNRTADTLRDTLEEQRRIADEQRSERDLLAGQVARYGALVERVSRGELNAKLESEGSGALATLGDNLNAMSAGLRTMTLRIHEAVGALSSSTAEIMATTQEHAAGASESASAVAQTVATVEEVSQAAHQMTETAQSVQAAARESQRTADSGRRAVRRTIEAMAAVKDQVAAIADRILSLSEQAQAVGHIITTVNELAEQSNMLALNASIEAARAGDEGRGFAIVAQEIRGLADQSRHATSQVRDILGQIQRSTSAAVLATEEGQKTVSASEAATRDAGETIEQLAGSLTHSSDAADRILAAAEQQAQGVRQISEAMHAIDQASRQTVEGTRMVEGAARDLTGLSTRLQEAVAQYRT